MALAVFVAGAIFFTDELVMPYLALVQCPSVTIIGQRPPVVQIPILFSVAVVMLGLPQLAFAVLGGFLSRRFKVITVRSLICYLTLGRHTI